VPPWPTWKHATKGTYLGSPVHDLVGTMADHAITLYQSNVRLIELQGPRV